LTVSPAALAGLDMAMLDPAGKFTNTPVYQVLGGPTRNQARALARIEGNTDDAIVAAVQHAHGAGHRAFQIPVPLTNSPNHSAALVNATQQRLDHVRPAVGPGCDFVLDAAGRLTPGDASTLAAAFERFHLLWFDEPCQALNLSAAYRIASENVTPIGFGRSAEAGVFQEMLRSEWFGFPAMRMVNGKYLLPEKPGLGFDLSEEALKKYPFAGSRPMASVFHKDGSVGEW
jgi:galactonate dehydratase